MAGISEKLIEEGRAALRFTHNKYDGEIAGIIAAAKADLSLHGILAEKVEDEDDALVKRAIMNYLKAEFGLDNGDSEKYREIYIALRTDLQLSDEYTVPAEGE